MHHRDATWTPLAGNRYRLNGERRPDGSPIIVKRGGLKGAHMRYGRTPTRGKVSSRVIHPAVRPTRRQGYPHADLWVVCGNRKCGTYLRVQEDSRRASCTWCDDITLVAQADTVRSVLELGLQASSLGTSAAPLVRKVASGEAFTCLHLGCWRVLRAPYLETIVQCPACRVWHGIEQPD